MMIIRIKKFHQLVLIYLGFMLLFWAQALFAEGILEQEKEPNQAQDTAQQVVIPQFLSTPQATFRHFLSTMQALRNNEQVAFAPVLQTLDLSDINKLIRPEKGKELAWILLEVIERTPLLDADYMIESLDEQQKTQTLYWYVEGEIELAKIGDGRWLFSKKTLANISLILDGMAEDVIDFNINKLNKDSYLPLNLYIKQQIPEVLKPSFLALKLWQWLGILLILTVGIVIDKIIQAVLSVGVQLILYRLAHGFYRTTSKQIFRPFALISMAGVWWYGLNLLSLPENVLLVLLLGSKFLLGLSAVWSMLRLIDLISAYFNERAQRTHTKLDNMIVPLITKITKVFIFVLGMVFIANILQMNVTGLLAGLGLGGLAFALAAKDAVENVFGSITVLMDRPFVVGDWVLIGDVEGTVEDIGFRSTRIRTFYNSLITLPNSRLITANVDNMGRRSYRRFRCHLGLTYDTSAEKVTAFCEGVRELVRLHPQTRKDYFHIYFNEYAASSLAILVYIFFQVNDWSEELEARHDFLLQILQLAERLDVSFAFPTQTLHFQAESAESPLGSSQTNATLSGQQHAQMVAQKFSQT